MRTSKLLPAPCSVNNTIHALPLSIRPSISRTPSFLSQPQHFTTRTCRRPLPVFRRNASTQAASSQIIRPLVPPPSEGNGPLLSRRADRDLPELPGVSIWFKTLPIFLILVAASSLAIFNYQKSSSSTVNSILYALRTNDAAREILGDEIYFASKTPWIRGEMNQLHGTIDIKFWVKGTKATAETKFVSLRRVRGGYFETLEWSLKLKDGTVVELLQDGAGVAAQKGPVPVVEAK